MTKQLVTTYSGFSKVSGSITFPEVFNLISGGTYEHLISKIGWLVQAGRVKEAANVKRQLPFLTITAQYREKRLPESIAGYNDLITIDIDGLSDEQVVELRPVIEQDPATVFNYLTPKQHGYKIIAHLVDAETEKLREKYLAAETISYERLEEYHQNIYELTRRHYEEMLHVEVDTSGKDISRGVFVSYDPQAFFSPERLAGVKPVTASIITPPPRATRKRKATAEDGKPAPKATEQNPADINPVTQLEFNKCIAAVQRKVRYKEGSYNTFLFALGNKCFSRGLDEAEVKLLAARRFGDNGAWDTDTPIGNGYAYTNKTEKAEEDKKNRKPTIEQVKEFLNERYRFRRNTIFDRLEFMDLLPDAASKEFRAMATKDINTIFLKLSEAGINYPFNNLKSVIDSDYAPPFDPIREYFDALPRWDGVTDHIKLLADTIQTTDQAYWHEVFRRWLVGMVRCAMGTLDINQQALLLYGK